MPIFGGPMSAGRYLFIDGQYLESAYKEMMTDFYGEPGELDVSLVAAGYQRIYYYHALEDELRTGETQPQMDARLATEEQRFDKIASHSYFHVRLGSVTGKSVRRRRQKQVDVQLAVDMLSHGFNHSMNHAALLAGDLDFKPVIDTLVGLGVATEVKFERKSASRYLYRAADIANEFGLTDAFNWSSVDFRHTHTIPSVGANSAPPHQHALRILRQGTWNGRAIELLQRGTDNVFTIHAPAIVGANSITVTYDDLGQLEKYFYRYHGPVTW